jgi:uncharacterized protein with PQ loop repeat
MRTAYLIAIGGVLIVCALMFFPTLHQVIGLQNSTEAVPLVRATATFLPWAFLLFVFYAINKLARR